MELVIGVIAGLIAVCVLWWTSSSARKLPPGPWGLPLVGYLPFLSSKPYVDLNRIAKRYGNILCLRLGGVNVVVLNDFPSTKEAFFQDACIGRPPEYPFQMNKENIETGAFFGLPWKEQRRFSIHVMRDIGLGKSKVEELVHEEIEELIKYIDMNADTPFVLRPRLMASTNNNIAALVYGKRFAYDDQIRIKLLEATTSAAAAAEPTAWMTFFPLLRKLYTFFAKPPNQFEREYTKKQIEEHDRTLDPGNVRDFIDGYLLEIKKRKNDPTFTKIILHDMASAFFGAGGDTIRVTVEWLLLISASNKSAQSRIQAEIQEVIGQSRLPTYQDHSKMPYTDAFIMEMMRWRTIVPISLIRKTITDTKLGGYFIPKGTRILSNTWAIHNNPEYWGPDVDKFNVERFLSNDGKEVKKIEYYMPFSVGKRSCPGEPLAKVEVFLYFTSILQRFNVSLPKGKVANFEGKLGVTFQPEPQDLIFSKRTE